MTGKTLNAVVIGTSFGLLTHVRALRQAGFEVVGLVGRDSARTAERARREKIPHALTDFASAIKIPGVDVVSIASPPHTHAEIAVAAAAAGKHIMCEKPFAANLAEAERMLAAVEKAGVVHMMGTEFRFATGQALATRAIRDGLIGTPKLATFTLMMAALADPKSDVPSWWSQKESGGGWFGAYASHIIDQMRTTLGEWSGLSASLSQVAERNWTADDSFTVHFKTVGGCAGILQSSAAAWGPFAVQGRITGSRGTLSIMGDSVSVADASGERALAVPQDLINPAPSPPDADLISTSYDMLNSSGMDLGPYTKLFEAMRRAIQGDTARMDPAPATFRDGVALQRIMDAARRSSQVGSWEKLA
jgi:predicted dehydrogenase